MSSANSKVEAPPQTYDVRKFTQYPYNYLEIQDLIFIFLDFEIRPDGFELVGLAAIQSSNPNNYPLAREYCNRVNSFLNPSSPYQLQNRQLDPSADRYLPGIKHLVIQLGADDIRPKFQESGKQPTRNHAAREQAWNGSLRFVEPPRY
ncbi:uncharacterized protein PAC_09564 [Phialocephala subalpina]|uniref:Uncharacterized protein n=1 Tax=Phialocephala subalpina TaxID=576137 RepID=A0A1L7X3R9_9HELO|nr:uncharacterized protein PAC_09564 [Phialocephala subalpina]